MHLLVHDDEAKRIAGEIAALWEERPDRVAEVTAQILEIRQKLLEWGYDGVSKDELDHATICFSRVVGWYACCQWLPFDEAPGWALDLYCLLMDEEAWEAARENDESIELLEQRLRASREAVASAA